MSYTTAQRRRARRARVRAIHYRKQDGMMRAADRLADRIIGRFAATD